MAYLLQTNTHTHTYTHSCTSSTACVLGIYDPLRFCCISLFLSSRVYSDLILAFYSRFVIHRIRTEIVLLRVHTSWLSPIRKFVGCYALPTYHLQNNMISTYIYLYRLLSSLVYTFCCIVIMDSHFVYMCVCILPNRYSSWTIPLKLFLFQKLVDIYCDNADASCVNTREMAAKGKWRREEKREEGEIRWCVVLCAGECVLHAVRLFKAQWIVLRVFVCVVWRVCFHIWP